jgi:predicted transcriptional regulator
MEKYEMKTGNDKDPAMGPKTESVNDVAVAEMIALFDKHFSTESHCTEALLSLVEQEIKCHRCGWCEIERIPGNRTGFCTICTKNVNLTATSIFRNMRSARPWLYALLLRGCGIVPTSRDINETLGMSKTSADKMLRRLSKCSNEVMEHKIQALSFSVFSAESKGQPQETENEEFCEDLHTVCDQPITDQLENKDIERSTTDENDRRSSPNGDLTNGKSVHEVQNIILELASKAPIYEDRLAIAQNLDIGTIGSALTMLELDGFIKRNGRGAYILASAEVEPPLQTQTTKRGGRVSQHKCCNADVRPNLSDFLSQDPEAIGIFVGRLLQALKKELLQNRKTT